MIEVNKIYNGNCLEVLKTFEDNSLDSCVTDPPYGLNFMNKHWDYDVPKVEVWKEVLRVLKPGGHLLCACGTRTQHRMAVNIEDAGFEIRDVITWHYGSGFPKSLNIAMAIDKQSGAIGHRGKAFVTAGAGEREDIQGTQGGQEMSYNNPVTDEAKEWNGWGTALKPATEFWTLARKPLSENTVAANVLKHSTGAINIDGSRIETEDDNRRNAKGGDNGLNGSDTFKIRERFAEDQTQQGRFPANVIFDEFAGRGLDEQTGVLKSGTVSPDGFKGEYTAEVYGKYANNIINPENVYGDSGGASRFFYCPKADNFERNKGCEKLQSKEKYNDFGLKNRVEDGEVTNDRTNQQATATKNNHPTVKPIDLMRYLVKLITPKRGICLDPYCGSGTTLIGCKLELINYVGIEMEEDYCKIAEARVTAWNPDKYKPQTLF